jgi:hypothetical protein
MKVLLIVLSVMMFGTVREASANQKTTACLNSCTAQLATCSDVCVGQFGMAAKSCRKAILKRCKKMGADAACPPDGITTTTNPGGPSATTSTTVRGGSPTTSTTLATSNCSGTWCDQGDGTVIDSATGLQWEKKTTEVGSGVNPADLHDVDNTYSWAGGCSMIANKYCQLNQSDEDACDANTSLGERIHGCQQCIGTDGIGVGGAEGTCVIPTVPTAGRNPITTVWDWIHQLNDSNFAGHNDWRLPNEAGCNVGRTPGTLDCSAYGPHELETILKGRGTECRAYACIDDIFGPTAIGTSFAYYYTSTSNTTDQNWRTWSVSFWDGTSYSLSKETYGFVRAVRTAQ